MPTTDFSRVPDAQLDAVVRSIQANPASVPNATERKAVVDEWNRRKLGLPPDANANLEAAATPITPDPVVKPKAPKPRATGAARVAEMEAQSQLDPGQSLDDFAQEYGASLRQRSNRWRREAEAASAAGIRPDDQRAYDAETGLLPDSSLPPMDGYNEVTKEYTTPRRALHPMIARDRAIAQQQEDETAAAIGKKYGPKNEQIYREGMDRGVVDYDAVQSPAEADANARWAQIENDARMSPDPSVRAEARKQLQEREQRARDNPSAVNQEVKRWAKATGLPRDQVAAMLANDPDAARTALRHMAGNSRDSRDKARQDHWRAMTMLAGGSQNINSGNQGMFSQLAMLPDEAPAGGGLSPRQQQLAYMLPGGTERAAIEGRQLDAAARIAGNAFTGALAGVAEQQGGAAAQRRADVQAAQQDFDTWHEKNVRAWGGRPYTRQDRDRMVTYLMAKYNIGRPAAEAIADSQPSAVAGNAAPPSDAGAMPSVSI